MAEFVELRAESCLRELEEMEICGLFTHPETTQIQINRREHLYRMEKKTKVKEDFVRYIEFELNLLTKIENRRVEMSIHDKQDVIDYKIKDRVRKAYVDSLLPLFPSDQELWKDFFNFCRRCSFWICGSRLLQDFAKFHGDKEDTWALASNFEIDAKNPSFIRGWLLTGLRMHPESILLHTAVIKLELDFAKEALLERSRRRRESDEKDANRERKQRLRGKCAEIAYQSAASVISDFKFYSDLYKLLADYPAAVNLRELVLEHIKIKFPVTEEAWNIRARIPMETEKDEPAAIIDVEAGSEIRKATVKERYKKCTDTFEEGIKCVPTLTMWTYYLDFLYEINQKTISNDNPGFKKMLWKRGFDAADEKGKVNEKHFIYYIDHLRRLGGKNKKIYYLLTKATEKYPTSAQLWFELVRYYLTRQMETEGLAAFRTANAKLSKNTVEQVLPLWNLTLQYLTTTTPDRVDDMFLEGIKLRADLGEFLKPKFIVWTVQTQGIGEARKFLRSPMIADPPCLPVYQQLIQLECIQPEPCLKSIRGYYETCARIFGSNNASVFIDYAKFELTMGDVTFVSRVHQRAINTLTGDQLDAFLSRYSLQDVQSLTQTIVMD